MIFIYPVRNMHGLYGMEHPDMLALPKTLLGHPLLDSRLDQTLACLHDKAFVFSDHFIKQHDILMRRVPLLREAPVYLFPGKFISINSSFGELAVHLELDTFAGRWVKPVAAGWCCTGTAEEYVQKLAQHMPEYIVAE
jgi:hypothetical protein